MDEGSVVARRSYNASVAGACAGMRGYTLARYDASPARICLVSSGVSVDITLCVIQPVNHNSSVSTSHFRSERSSTRIISSQSL